jgi:PAS domain S-box-containing protein
MKVDFSFSKHIVKKRSLIHSLLAVLIGGDSKVGWLEILFKVISEIQIIAMLLTFSFEFLDNSQADTLGTFMKTITNYISLKDVLPFNSNSSATNIVLVVILVYIAILVIYTVAFVVTHFMKKTLPMGLLKIWINMSVIHFTCFFLYIHQCAMGMIKAASDNQVYILGSTKTGLFTSLGVLIIIISTLYALLSSRFVYEPIKCQYIAALRTTLPDLLALAFKGIDVIFRVVITNDETQKWIRLVFMLIILAYRLRVYVTKIPYYYFDAMRMFQALIFVEFAISLLNLIMEIINEGKTVNSSSLMYMALVLSTFFAKASDVLLHRMIRSYGLIEIDSIKTKDTFYKKLFAVDYILEQGSISATIEKKQRESFTEFLYYGVIKAHKVKCKKIICGCNLVLEKEAMNEFLPLKEDQRKIMRAFKFEIIEELFKGFPDPEIQVTLANYLFENKIQSYAAAITIIHGLTLQETTLEIRVIRAKLLEKIENKVLTNYDSTIDIQEIIQYQRLSTDLRKIIENNLSKYLKFWETYKGAEPNIGNLFNMSVEINNEAEEVAQIWNSIITRHSKLSYQDHLLYGLYQSLVRSAPYSAEKVLQKYLSLSALFSIQRNRNVFLTPENVFEPQNILIYIIMKKEQIGNVLFTTPNVENVFQYSSYDLLGKNVNTLMPGFYKERHNRILTAHVDKSRTSIMNRNRAVFGQKRDGYILPITLYVSIFPYFQNQLIYIGILRPVQTFDEFVLVLPNGTLDGFSENVAKTLGLEPERVREYDLKDICAELEKYHRAFDYLKTGNREKLRTVAYSRKDRTSGSVRSHHTDQSASQSKEMQAGKTTFTHKTTTDETNDIFQEEEFYQWVRLYDLFTSTGVPMLFNKYVEGEGGGKKGPKIMIEFNTILIEEVAYGSKLTIFRLQSVSTDIIQNEQFEELELEQEPTFEEKSLKSESGTDLQSPTAPFRLPLEAQAQRAKLELIEPSSATSRQMAQTLMTEPLQTEEAELLSSKNRNKLVKLKTLKPEKEEDTERIPDLLEEDDFDVPDDDDLISFNNSILKNPIMARMLNSQPNSAVPKIQVAEEPQLNLITEDNEEHAEKDDPVTLQARQLAYLRRATGSVIPDIQTPTAMQDFRKPSVKLGDFKTMGKLSDTENSFEGQGDQKESEKRQKLKRFFQKHKLLVLDGGNGLQDGQERSSVASSSTKSTKVGSKVERAIYNSTVDTSIKILNYIVGGFCIVAVIMVIYYLLISNSNLNRVKSNIEVQKQSTLRLYLIVETNRMARIINIIQRGLSPASRLYPDDVIYNLEEFPEVSDSLSSANNQVRLSISKIDKSEQPRFYGKLPIQERGSSAIKKLNSLDACTEIVNSGFRLNSLLPGKPDADDPDLTFILENTLNDLVVNNEDIANILLDDNQISLARVEHTVLILMIVTLIISIGIILFVGRSELRFIKRKTNFLDSFLRIKDYELDGTLGVVNSLYTALKDNDRDERLMQKLLAKNLQQSAGPEVSKVDGKKEHRAFKAKSANTRGMNVLTYINLGLVTFFVLIFVLIFGILLGVFVSYEGSISKLMLRVINTNANLFQFGLIFTSLYEYISENDSTTIRDEPIGSEWERTYHLLTASNDFFNSFSDQDATFNDQMVTLLNGNLCSMLFSDRSCATEVTGIGARGILGINAFILKDLREIKDYYDNSDKTTASQITALTMQDFLDVEVAYTIYTTRSYNRLTTVITNQFNREVDELMKRSIIIGVVSIVMLLILVKLVWLQAISRMEEERKNFRSIMRVVPVNIVMTNRYLKNYLMRNSDRILDSIKNKI